MIEDIGYSDNPKIKKALALLEQAFDQEALRDLAAAAKNHSGEVFISADGKGVEFNFEGWDGKGGFTLKRSWKQIFLDYQYEVDFAKNLGQLEDGFECLKMAEQGVAVVQARLKKLRAALEKKRLTLPPV